MQFKKGEIEERDAQDTELRDMGCLRQGTSAYHSVPNPSFDIAESTLVRE